MSEKITHEPESSSKHDSFGWQANIGFYLFLFRHFASDRFVEMRETRTATPSGTRGDTVNRARSRILSARRSTQRRLNYSRRWLEKTFSEFLRHFFSIEAVNLNFTAIRSRRRGTSARRPCACVRVSVSAMTESIASQGDRRGLGAAESEGSCKLIDGSPSDE